MKNEDGCTKNLTEVIKEHFRSDIIVAEIGVYLGENAPVLLRDVPNIKKMLLINPYKPCEDWISNTVDIWAIEREGLCQLQLWLNV